MFSVSPLEALVLLAPVGLGLAVLYALLRWFAWTPRGVSPVGSARVHGLVVALIAFLVSCSPQQEPADGVLDAGVDRPAPDGPGAVVLDPAVTRVAGVEALPFPEPALWPLLAALAPAGLFLLVWWIGQHTWPRSTGPVRQGRLTALELRDVLPRALTWTCAAATLASAGAVAALAASGLPAVPARRITMEVDVAQAGNALPAGPAEWQTQVVAVDGAQSAAATSGLLAVVLLGWVAATALAVRAVLRRPVLAGLHPATDLAVRRVAVNRILRTALVAVVGTGLGVVWTWDRLERTARGHALDPTGERWPEASQAVAGVSTSVSSLALPAVGLMIVTLIAAALWRSPALAVLAEAPGVAGADGRPWTPAPSAAPGTARAVRALRDREGMTALSLTLLSTLVLSTGDFPLPAEDGPVSQTTAAALVTTGPFLLGMVVLAVAEARVRRDHAAPVPAGPGVKAASRWRRVLLALAAVVAVPAAAWTAHHQLPLVIGHVQARGVDAAATAGMLLPVAVVTLLALAAAHAAGCRGPLTRADAVEDAVLRRSAVNRFLALGTGAVVAFAGQAWPLLHHARVLAAGSPGWATGETWQQPWLLLGLGLLLAFLPGTSVDPRSGRTVGEEPSRAEVEAHRTDEPSATESAA
ncbi:hypothetical protein [Micrococcus lacusdianchii]|uniref:hypothetical protein n=1 Tax=Micrococcus lacusdianchii TaxID=2915940 RepID=UPI002005B562|nr:hypothetical protein [Micrococcus sp. JXJ CY 30]